MPFAKGGNLLFTLPARAKGPRAFGIRLGGPRPPDPGDASLRRGLVSGPLHSGRSENCQGRLPFRRSCSRLTTRGPPSVGNGRPATGREALPGAPLLAGLPPRFFRHWRRSAPPPCEVSLFWLGGLCYGEAGGDTEWLPPPQKAQSKAERREGACSLPLFPLKWRKCSWEKGR